MSKTPTKVSVQTVEAPRGPEPDAPAGHGAREIEPFAHAVTSGVINDKHALSQVNF